MSRLGWLLLVTAGCGSATVPGRDAGFGGGQDAGGHHASAALQRCSTTSAAVRTIAAVTARVNALPAGASVACLVASLPRPLALGGSTSTFSAQPASGAANPRIFLLSPTLILTVAPEGAGSDLVEIGELVTSSRTLKGELQLPATLPLAPDAALTRVEQSNGTTSCGVCHRTEQPHPVLPHGYVSVAFRPNPGTEVKLPALSAEHQRCVDTGEASARCELYHALFDFGGVGQGTFSSQLELFF